MVKAYKSGDGMGAQAALLEMTTDTGAGDAGLKADAAAAQAAWVAGPQPNGIGIGYSLNQMYAGNAVDPSIKSAVTKLFADCGSAP